MGEAAARPQKKRNKGWDNLRGHEFKPNDPATGAKDPRINRTGIRHRDTLADVIQRFLGDPNAQTRTALLDMIELMARSRHPADHRTLLEYGYGKVPLDITSGGQPIQPKVIEIIKRVVEEEDKTDG